MLSCAPLVSAEDLPQIGNTDDLHPKMMLDLAHQKSWGAVQKEVDSPFRVLKNYDSIGE